MEKLDVCNLVELFGLYVDYDQWDVDGKNWIRIKSRDWDKEYGYKNRCLILYKDDGYDIILSELQQSLIHLGQNIRSREIRKLLNFKI